MNMRASGILTLCTLFLLCGPALAEPIALDTVAMDSVTAGGAGRGHAVAPFLVLPQLPTKHDHHHEAPDHRDRSHQGTTKSPVMTVSSGSVSATASATGPGSTVKIVSIERVTAQGVFIITTVSASGGQSASASLMQMASVTTTSLHH